MTASNSVTTGDCDQLPKLIVNEVQKRSAASRIDSLLNSHSIGRPAQTSSTPRHLQDLYLGVEKQLDVFYSHVKKSSKMAHPEWSAVLKVHRHVSYLADLVNVMIPGRFWNNGAPDGIFRAQVFNPRRLWRRSSSLDLCFRRERE